MGLLEHDQHLERTLREAALTRMPTRLCELFATILTKCEPANTIELWDLFKNNLSEDILQRQRRLYPRLDLNFNEQIYSQTLILIEDLCVFMVGKLLIQLGHIFGPNRDHLDMANCEIARESNYDRPQLEQFVQDNEAILVADRRSAHDITVESIENSNGGIFGCSDY